MLLAEKQLLDANLRNDLQILRRMEIKMLVNRYQTAIQAATLVAGFTFTGVVEFDLLEEAELKADDNLRVCQSFFHLFAAIALSSSVYALAVSSIAIMLGQRLAIQATAQLTSKHEANVSELASKFVTVLVSLLISLVGVVGATVCATWARAEEGVNIAATVLLLLMLPFCIWAICTMNARLNDNVNEPSSISVKGGAQTLNVSEFRVGDKYTLPKDAAEKLLPQSSASKPDERSSLLKCLPPQQSK